MYVHGCLARQRSRAVTGRALPGARAWSDRELTQRRLTSAPTHAPDQLPGLSTATRCPTPARSSARTCQPMTPRRRYPSRTSAVRCSWTAAPTIRSGPPARTRCGSSSHLTAARFAYPHVLYRYQGAGHYVNLLVPYQPGEIVADLARPIGQGNTLLANANAHARLWAQLLGFLAHPEGHTGVITAPSTPPPLTPRSASR